LLKEVLDDRQTANVCIGVENWFWCYNSLA